LQTPEERDPGRLQKVRKVSCAQELVEST
jgi:hypothetical protein